MNESEPNFSFENKRLSLIDVSFEDDCLYDSPSRDFPFPRLSGNKMEAKSNLGFADANNAQPATDSFEGGEEVPKPLESKEPERAKKSAKYNLRKSLAWDNAFFTSAGFLEPEELSTMTGAEKGGKNILPGIEEDIHGSTDSICTLASDNLSLENLEADLFVDIRASIQRTSKGSDVVNSSSKLVSPKTEIKTTQSSEKVNVASQNKLKAKAATNKPSTVMQVSERTTKQPVTVNGESKSLPKIVGRVGPISATATKRASLGVNRINVEKDKGRGAKLPALGVSRNSVPRPMLPGKPSLRSSVARKAELTATSLVDSSGSLSSDCSNKSSLNSVRRKGDSRTGNHSSSGSTVKTTLKIPPRNKNQPTSSHISPYLKSETKISSSVSPASSISEWSSASLSPTSTLNKRCKSSRSSADTSSCKDDPEDSDASHILDPQNHSNDAHYVGHGAHTGLLGECVKKFSIGSSTIHPDSAKPSGLRLPSPKIGFFDGVRSAVRTPNRSKQSPLALPSGLPGSGTGSASPCGWSSEAKFGHLQPARTAVRSTKIGEQAAVSGTKTKSPLFPQEPKNAALKVCSSSKNEKRNACTSLKVPNGMSPQSGGRSSLKAEKVGSEKCDTVTDNSDLGFTIRTASPSFLKGEIDMESMGHSLGKDLFIIPCNQLPDMTIDSSSIPKVESMSSLEKVGDVMGSQTSINNSFPSGYDTNEKEKAATEGGLTEQIGALDIHVEMHEKADGHSLSLSHNAFSRFDSGTQEGFKESSKLSCSPQPAMESTVVEVEIEKADAATLLHPATIQGRPLDGETS